METVMQFTFVLEAASAAMLLVLLYIYLKSRKVLKNAFTLGLVVFAGFLFLNSIGMLYTHAYTAGIYKIELGFVFATAILKVVALAALLYITWKGV